MVRYHFSLIDQDHDVLGPIVTADLDNDEEIKDRAELIAHLLLMTESIGTKTTPERFSLPTTMATRYYHWRYRKLEKNFRMIDVFAGAGCSDLGARSENFLMPGCAACGEFALIKPN